MTKYTEADKGRFEASLLRDGVEIAFTNYDVVKITDNFRECDRAAVEDFADSYDLPIEDR